MKSWVQDPPGACVTYQLSKVFSILFPKQYEDKKYSLFQILKSTLLQVFDFLAISCDIMGFICNMLRTFELFYNSV